MPVLTLMLHSYVEKNAQECVRCGGAQAWTGRGVLDVREALSETSTAADGLLSRERSGFYRCRYSSLGLALTEQAKKRDDEIAPESREWANFRLQEGGKSGKEKMVLESEAIEMVRNFLQRHKSKESRPKGSSFGLAPEEVRMFFPLLREPHEVTTFRIGDLGFVLRAPTLRAGSRFRIEINKAPRKNLFRIPQSAFRNPQMMCSSTPKQLANFVGKVIEQGAHWLPLRLPGASGW